MNERNRIKRKLLIVTEMLNCTHGTASSGGRLNRKSDRFHCWTWCVYALELSYDPGMISVIFAKAWSTNYARDGVNFVFFYRRSVWKTNQIYLFVPYGQWTRLAENMSEQLGFMFGSSPFHSDGFGSTWPDRT